MPTDPFVAPDPDARPRQQQNLPPGVAMPAPERWEPTRPAELGAEQPTGELYGNPGPNVGYAYTLAHRVEDRLRLSASEDVHDVVPVIAEIAGKRAASYGRAPVMSDIDRAILLLGYDGSADDAFVAARASLVHEAGHSYPRRRALVDAAPIKLLRASPPEFRADVNRWRAEFARTAATPA